MLPVSVFDANGHGGRQWWRPGRDEHSQFCSKACRLHRHAVLGAQVEDVAHLNTAVAVKDAEPEEAVASPSPASEPAPAVCANDTTVELSAVTTLLFASSTAAVSVFVEPDATLVVFDVKTSFVAVPGVTENVELSVVRPPPCFAAWIVTEPAV